MSDLSNFPSFGALVQSSDIDSLLSSLGVDLSHFDDPAPTPTPSPTS